MKINAIIILFAITLIYGCGGEPGEINNTNNPTDQTVDKETKVIFNSRIEPENENDSDIVVTMLEV